MNSSISHPEIEQRIDRARDLVLAEGFDGFLVWGRGGGSHDGYADLFYFSGVYVDFPLLGNFEPEWSDRAFGALLVTKDSCEFFSFPTEQPESISPAIALVPANVLAETIASRIDEHGLGTARFALIGGGNMTWRQSSELQRHASELSLKSGDDIAHSLRMKKSQAELQLLHAGARLTRHVVEGVLSGARPGDSVDGLNADAISQAISAGATVSNLYTDAYSTSIEDGPTVLRRGDQVTMDLTGTLNGYFFDVCRTTTIDAPPPDVARDLFELARETVKVVAEKLTPGNPVSEAANAGFETLRSAGYDWRNDEFQALGHGLGLGFEPPWIHPADMTVVETGMVFAVERYCSGSDTCGAYEDVFVVTDDGPRVLADLSADELLAVSPSEVRPRREPA